MMLLAQWCPSATALDLQPVYCKESKWKRDNKEDKDAY